jgi:hypothetical protein
MSQVSQKLQFTASTTTTTTSISGYDVETGNALVAALNQYFPANSVNTPISLSFNVANLQSICLLSDKGCTLTTNGTGSADVQTVSISGTPTGGTFALGFKGAITAPIAYNATAAAVQSALQALATIGAGNVTCTGGPLPGTAVTCTFAGTLATGLQPAMAQNSGGLTGGSSPTVTVTHATPGWPQDTIVLKPGIPLIWGVSSGQPCPFAGNVTTAYVTCTPAQNLQITGVTL